MTISETIPLPTKRGLKRDRANPEQGGCFADMIQPLVTAGRLTHGQALGAMQFIRDLQADAGSSGAIAACYAERVQTSRGTTGSRPVGWTHAANRVQSILDSLMPYEKSLLDFLVRNREYARRNLSDFGRERSGYSNLDHASGFAVGQIACLLERIAYLYATYHRRT